MSGRRQAMLESGRSRWVLLAALAFSTAVVIFLVARGGGLRPEAVVSHNPLQAPITPTVPSPEFTLPPPEPGSREAVVRDALYIGVIDSEGQAAKGESAGVDLGDIVLEQARDLVFRVQDEAGEPIEDAVARALDAPIVSQPTDAEGMGVLSALPLAQHKLEFSALGFRSQVVAVPPDRTRVTGVFLIPLSRISIRVRTASGMFVPGVVVALSVYGEDAFDAAYSNTQVELGASYSRKVTWYDDRVVVMYETDPRGEVLVTGVSVGSTLTVQVKDARGEAIAPERTLRIREPGEEVLVFTVDDEPASCEVIVTDARGSPIEDASVRVEGTDDSADTDKEGRALLRNLFGERVELEVSRSGYASTRVEAPLTPVRPSRVEVALLPGRAVVLTVLDQAGHEAGAESAEALADGVRVSSRPYRLGPGSFQLLNLPDAPLVLRAKVGGRWFERAYDAFGESATIHVPSFGSMNLKWVGQALDPEMMHLVAIKPLGGGDEIRRSATSAEIEPGLLVPVVFPGEYQVRLWGKLADGTPLEPTPTATVVVHADQESTVVLAP